MLFIVLTRFARSPLYRREGCNLSILTQVFIRLIQVHFLVISSSLLVFLVRVTEECQRINKGLDGNRHISGRDRLTGSRALYDSVVSFCILCERVSHDRVAGASFSQISEFTLVVTRLTQLPGRARNGSFSLTGFPVSQRFIWTWS